MSPERSTGNAGSQLPEVAVEGTLLALSVKHGVLLMGHQPKRYQDYIEALDYNPAKTLYTAEIDIVPGFPTLVDLVEAVLLATASVSSQYPQGFRDLHDTQTKAAADLKAGDCFNVPTTTTFQTVETRPCAEAHTGEVFHTHLCSRPLPGTRRSPLERSIRGERSARSEMPAA